MAKALYADHTRSTAEIGKSLGISRATLYLDIPATPDAQPVFNEQ